MPTRENKSNAAGRGESEGKPIRQSNPKGTRSVGTNKKTTGSRTKKNSRQVDPSGHERIHDGVKLGSPGQMTPRKFNLLVDNVPYFVTAKVYQFNGEKRYSVSINGNEEHIFTWDSDLKRLKAIDDESSTLPDNLEEAISTKLQSKA